MAQFKFIQWLVDFILAREFEFEWDEGNKNKSVHKHGINNHETEEAFFDENIIVLGLQTSPESPESRFGILGKTKDDKLLFLNFTIRNLKIRIISSRKANLKERSFYEKERNFLC